MLKPLSGFVVIHVRTGLFRSPAGSVPVRRVADAAFYRTEQRASVVAHRTGPAWQIQPITYIGVDE